ncbi:MAG TPA: hypothetical protein VG963_05695, partial [Polyangiaceae bacterium]|nr:hypothetical protein [Polyangiaceae bacterium]
MKWKTVAWIGAGSACAMWLGRAASSSRGATLASDGSAASSAEGRDRAPRRSCELAPNGTLCNHPVSGICVSNRCVGVSCGDGIVYGDEECDD